MSASDLTRLFQMASLQHEAYKNFAGDDWHRYRTIRTHYEIERAELNRVYRIEYDTRLEVARTELLRRATQKQWDHRPRFVVNGRLDHQAIERQAHRQVRDAHISDLTKLEAMECDHLRALIEESRSRAPTPPPREAGPQELQRLKQSFQSAAPPRTRTR